MPRPIPNTEIVAQLPPVDLETEKQENSALEFVKFCIAWAGLHRAKVSLSAGIMPLVVYELVGQYRGKGTLIQISEFGSLTLVKRTDEYSIQISGWEALKQFPGAKTLVTEILFEKERRKYFEITAIPVY